MVNKKELNKLSIYELNILQKAYKNLRSQLMVEEECDLYIPCPYCGYRNLCMMLFANIKQIDIIRNRKIKEEHNLLKSIND